MLAHVIPLIVAWVSSLGWAAALVIWLVYKEKSKFVAFHALQQLLLMLALWIAAIAGVVAFFTVVGIPVAILLWIAVGIAGIVLPVVAAIKANNGEWWEYPFVGSIARNIVNGQP